jgi:hypothetical protein
MELLAVSLLALISGALITAYPILRWRQAAERRQTEHERQLQAQLDDLQTQLTVLTQQLASLRQQPTSASRFINPDSLTQIEQLSDPQALTDTQALQTVVEQLASLPTGVTSDLFEADRKILAISRLIEHGHPLPEVARRLSLPLGEVELLSSLRSS